MPPTSPEYEESSSQRSQRSSQSLRVFESESEFWSLGVLESGSLGVLESHMLSRRVCAHTAFVTNAALALMRAHSTRADEARMRDSRHKCCLCAYARAQHSSQMLPLCVCAYTTEEPTRPECEAVVRNAALARMRAHLGGLGREAVKGARRS